MYIPLNSDCLMTKNRLRVNKLFKLSLLNFIHLFSSVHHFMGFYSTLVGTNSIFTLLDVTIHIKIF